MPTAKKYVFEPMKRQRILRLYAGILKLHRKKRAKKNEIDYYFSEAIEENSILISGLGRSVRGSMQYLLNELNSRDEFRDYRIYVRTNPELTDETVRGYIEQNGWNRTKALPNGLPKKMESCKYLITESYFPYSWIKKPGQVMIDLWHGTPLKRLGVLKSGDKCHNTAIQHKNFLSADYLLYPNEFTKNVMWESYGITSLLSAKALMMGYPRTAGIISIPEEKLKEIRNSLGPNGERIYAYMPTFRGYLTDEETVAREKLFLDYLDGELRDDQILYVNLHHHVKEGIDFGNYRHIKAFPPLLDSYTLLAATDALISDYSSVFFDYLVTRKQIILYIEDLEEYLLHQGLNINIEELPFDLAASREQVVEMLNRGKQYDDSEYFEAMCAYDSPDNPEKLSRLFRGDESGLILEDIPDSDRKKIIIYSRGCAAGRDTSRLEEITQLYDKEKAEIYVSCDEGTVSKNMDGAYPMLHNTLVIGSKTAKTASSLGAPVRELYLKGKLSFRMMMGLMQYEYALIPIRMYGYVHFDTICIYDASNPETLIGLALSDADRKILFISDEMHQEIKSGNRFLKDAVRYAAEYCELVVLHEDAEKDGTIRALLRSGDREKLIAAESAEEVLGFLK